MEGSGSWLLSDSKFKNWLDIESSSNVLWLHGGPGVGKSMLCSHVVDTVKAEHPDAAVIINYFIFDEKDSLLTIYRNIALQLFQDVYGPTRETSISDEVIQLIRGPISAGVMQAFIEILVSELETTYIFLDGLDEELQETERAENTESVLKFMKELAESEHLSLKLFCSSQDRSAIRPVMTGAQEIELNAAANSDDIDQLFANAANSIKSGNLDSSDDWMMVLGMLKDLVNGNFLWATYMLREINDARNMKQVVNVFVKGLPSNFETYLQQKMGSVNAQYHEDLRYVSQRTIPICFLGFPLFSFLLCQSFLALF